MPGDIPMPFRWLVEKVTKSNPNFVQISSRKWTLLMYSISYPVTFVRSNPDRGVMSVQSLMKIL